MSAPSPGSVRPRAGFGPGPIQLVLPATSANLGPGFDAAAVALALELRLRAVAAPAWRIRARGRDRDICAGLEGNLLVSTYRQVLTGAGRSVPPLRLEVENRIPIGKGCGSSAAARLAGISLAVHFGDLRWSEDRIEHTAAELEGHGDNAAACWRGGAVCCAGEGREFEALELGRPRWPLLLAMPAAPLATVAARAALPSRYSRADAVANIQAAMWLASALATGRREGLNRAMRDRLHQPYRAQLCPLLAALQPLAAAKNRAVAGVALSGAGPAVLMVVNGAARLAAARRQAQTALRRAGLNAEFISTSVTGQGARASWRRRGEGKS